MHAGSIGNAVTPALQFSVYLNGHTFRLPSISLKKHVHCAMLLLPLIGKLLLHIWRDYHHYKVEACYATELWYLPLDTSLKKVLSERVRQKFDRCSSLVQKPATVSRLRAWLRCLLSSGKQCGWGLSGCCFFCCCFHLCQGRTGVKSLQR